jgi:hypothetical protein
MTIRVAFLASLSVVEVACQAFPFAAPSPAPTVPACPAKSYPLAPDVTAASQYTVSADGNVVTDLATGLSWERQLAATACPPPPDQLPGPSTCQSWQDAQSYCQGLSLGVYPSGWRLPTVSELVSLIDFASSAPALATGTFPYQQTAASVEWAAPPPGADSDKGFIVDFSDGEIHLNVELVELGGGYSVRCVHGPTTCDSADSGAYVVQNGTVYDPATDLTWQQDAPPGQYPWSSTAAAGSAQAYCESLNLGGASGWRLPALKELLSIVDARTVPTIGAAFQFQGSPLNHVFWTSALLASDEAYAWTVDFDHGVNSYEDANITAAYVRCVR